jgi:peptidoglycan/LPS O-acetylase OafA/YrhL
VRYSFANSQKLHGLDHLRTLAIALVFLFHYFILSGGQPSWLPAVASFGWTGVDLFFVLSGFLISSQLFSQIKSEGNFSLKDFYIKRFFRIIPPFLVTVSIYFLIPFFREKEALPPLWKFLSFTQNFGLNIRDQGTFSHAWSLCVEEHFYFLLPLVLLLLTTTRSWKRCCWLIPLLFIGGIAIRFYCYQKLFLPFIESSNGGVIWYKQIYYPTYNRLDGLLAGVSIAALYHFRPDFWNGISKYGNLFLAFGLLTLTAAWFLCAHQQSFEASIFGFPLIAMGYGFAVAGAVSPSSFLYRLKSKTSSLIATLSYSVYLTHKGIIHVTRELLGPFHLNENLLLIVCIVTCLFGAFILHMIVEKPFLKWRKMILQQTKKSIHSTPAEFAIETSISTQNLAAKASPKAPPGV